mgnify:CR=1 FL=1
MLMKILSLLVHRHKKNIYLGSIKGKHSLCLYANEILRYHILYSQRVIPLLVGVSSVSCLQAINYKIYIYIYKLLIAPMMSSHISGINSVRNFLFLKVNQRSY